MYREKEGESYRPWIPAEQVSTVLYLYHDQALRAHFGEEKMVDRIRESFYWPSWREDVRKWIKNCACQGSKATRGHQRGLAQSYTQYGPYQALQADIVGPFPKSKRGNKYWLTLVDLSLIHI